MEHQRDSATKKATQDSIGSTVVSSQVPCSLRANVEMPFQIQDIQSPSHKLRVKQTATKAVLETVPNASFDEGFTLLITLAEIHVPRMWVEDSDQSSFVGGFECERACMLAFYPEFNVDPPDDHEFFIVVDQSCSMEV